MNEHRIAPVLLEREVRIHVAGCGGNGSQVLYGLARLDRALRALGHPGGLFVAAFDPDRVSEANIGRQLFSPSDIGLNKAAVLVDRINKFLGLRWEACPQKYSGQTAWPGTMMGGAADILITCVDSAKARREIHHAITTEQRRGANWTPAYWVDLGNRQSDGQVILGQPVDAINSRGLKDPDRLPTVVEVFPELLNPKLAEDNRPSCSLAESLESQDLFINDFISREALDLLSRLFRYGKVDYRGIFVNRLTGEYGRLPIAPVSAIADKPKSRRAA